jgi:hypothetical protein
MPTYLIRREMCVPYEIAVEASSLAEAEEAALEAPDSMWSVGSRYWQDLLTEETDREPDISVLTKEGEDAEEDA